MRFKQLSTSETANGVAAPNHRLIAQIADILTCLCVFIVLVVHCVVRSPKKLFWLDEVLTEAVVDGTTFSQMLNSLSEPINASPPTYFVAIWAWAKIFGASELSLRMFSCLALGMAWLFCWLLLRQFCARVPAASASIAGLFLSESVLYYNVEARCYALYLAAWCAACYLYVRCWKHPDWSNRTAWIAIFLAHALLVTTHYVGSIFSGALIVIAVFGAWVSGFRSLRAYTYASCGGLSTAALCLPFFIRQSKLGFELNWLQVPAFSDLAPVYRFGFDATALQVICLTIAVAVLLADTVQYTRRRRRNSATSSEISVSDPGRAAVLAGTYSLCVCAGATPLVVWCESQFGFRLFLDRYLLPAVIIWPCIFGIVFQRIWAVRWSIFARCLILAAHALLVLYVMQSMAQDSREISPELNDMRELARITRNENAYLATLNFMRAGPARHYGALVKFVEREEFDTVLSPVGRLFWQDFLIKPADLQRSRERLLIPREEWDYWAERGFLRSDQKVESASASNLLIIE